MYRSLIAVNCSYNDDDITTDFSLQLFLQVKRSSLVCMVLSFNANQIYARNVCNTKIIHRDECGNRPTPRYGSHLLAKCSPHGQYTNQHSYRYTPTLVYLVLYSLGNTCLNEYLTDLCSIIYMRVNSFLHRTKDSGRW